MVAEMPWALRRSILSSFVHDSKLPLQRLDLVLELAARQSKRPEIEPLLKGFRSVARGMGKVHQGFSTFRKREDPPAEAELNETLDRYRRALERGDKKISSLLKELETFHAKNRRKLPANANKSLGTAVGYVKEFLSGFPAKDIGRKIKVNSRAQSILGFMRLFSRGRFVDRRGKQVNVVFRPRDVSALEAINVHFDEKLLHRGLYNLVTDAISHSPGRPIQISLTRRNGQVAINVTNHGRKLTPQEIAKIGHVRFTRSRGDPRRGYGKMSTRMLTEAQGGTFRAGNSRIGPKLTVTMPVWKKRKRR